jgi:hypothetical protein
MDDFLAIFTEKAAWPMVHVFVPAVLAIYAKNIWTVIAVIYLFESVEYMVSILPGGEYWSDVGANALVSDIIMGLTGAWLVQIIGKTEYTSDKRPWYAILKYKKSGCYQRVQPFLHVVLAAASSGFASISILMDILPEDSPQEFIYFGISYIFFALLFGKDRFAAIAFILISIISMIAIFTGYTMVVSFAVVFSYFLYNKIKLKPNINPKNLDYPEVLPTVQLLQKKQSNRMLEF